MFQQLKNLDTAFKYTRVLSLVSIVSSALVCGFIYYTSVSENKERSKQVFVIANGKIFSAFAEEREKMWPIQIRDHVRMFHFYFYNVQPDMEAIKKNMGKALLLADNSAANEYKNLLESGYFNAILSANVTQEVECDSVAINLNSVPWRFQYYGTQKIIRATSIVNRSLVTMGELRVTRPTDQNPHGLIIEKWKIIENKDLKTEGR